MFKFPSVVRIPTNSTQTSRTPWAETAGRKKVDVQRHSRVPELLLGSDRV